MMIRYFYPGAVKLRDFGQDVGHCVTGTIEDGATPQQAIMRETIEEIDIHLDIPPKLAVVVSLADSNNFIEPGYIF